MIGTTIAPKTVTTYNKKKLENFSDKLNHVLKRNETLGEVFAGRCCSRRITNL